MTRSRFLAFGLLGLVLSACSGGEERPTLNLQIYEAVRESIASRLEPEETRPPVTRAVLDTLDGAFMEVVAERRDQLAYLYVSAVRQDPHRGVTVLWRTEDDVVLALRNDVLITTKGLGGDLLSSEVQQAPTVVGPAATGGLRRMNFLAADNQAVPVTFACEVTDLGIKTIVVVERAHRTRHLQERCEGATGEIVNEYWIDSVAELAWQSRQWAGPEIGYLRFRRLTN